MTEFTPLSSPTVTGGGPVPEPPPPFHPEELHPAAVVMDYEGTPVPDPALKAVWYRLSPPEPDAMSILVDRSREP